MKKLPALLIAALLVLAPLAARAGEAPDPAAQAWVEAGKHVKELRGRGDFDGVRTALKMFLAQYPEAPAAPAARDELKAVEKAADRQIQALWDDAEAASGRKKYDQARELYSGLISRGSNPELERKAREALARNDAATAPACEAARKKAETLFAAWKFTEAAKVADEGQDGLVGTKWAEPATRLEGETQAVRDLFGRFIAKVEASAREPRKTPFKLKDLTGWEVRAEIVRADEQKLSITVTGAGRELPWKDMDPARVLELFELYGTTPADHYALGILFLRQGKKDAAGPRFLAARGDARLFDSAEYYLKVLAGTLNKMTYDFSQGLQILDWEARGGRWLISRGELVQDAAEGEGELVLARPACQSKEARFFFDLTALSDKGAVSVLFLQDDRNFFGFTISREGYSAFASVGGKVTTVKDAAFKLPPNRKCHVRCGLKGSEFGLSFDQARMPRLTAPGLDALEGRLVLRTLDCRAAFDNIEVSNRGE